MFKVICIDASEHSGSIDSPSGWELIENEIYDVCDDWYDEQGILIYALEQDPDHEDYGWKSNRFIPLSNIDEREMLHEVSIYRDSFVLNLPDTFIKLSNL